MGLERGIWVTKEQRAARKFIKETTNPRILKITEKLSIANLEEGGIGSIDIKTARELHTIVAGLTSITTTLAIPKGVILLGASFNVDVAVVTDGSNVWGAIFQGGSSTQMFTSTQAGTLNTKVDGLIDPELTTGITEITFEADGDTFSAGVIEAVAYYIDVSSLGNV